MARVSARAHIAPRLRSADAADFPFCEALSRDNMRAYLVSRGIEWSPERFRASWREFENFVIEVDGKPVGLLRLTPEDEALGLRDLQILPGQQCRGIGAWAMREALSLATERGFHRVQLRVYEENPARAWYARLGFAVDSSTAGKLRMSRPVLPRER